ncbi:hypothetical protein BGW80DRAFT_1464097 [Lactifluus volemus]|nr:hypothetical protein BGW80DRAFT_1464097 [Lactifluus volemus]
MLSSTSLSIISLWILSSLSSTVAFSIVLLDRFSLCLNIPWAKIAFFPAIWASSWQLISHASPVGHLVTWSPVTGIASYEWVRPLFGAWGINWLVGAYAIVVAELVGAWFIGPVEDFEPPGPLIPSVVSDADPQPLTSKPAFPKTTYHSLLLGTALLGLTLPSFFLPTVPTFPWSVSSTPLPIGCVLPHPSQPDDGITPLDRFIVESRQHNGARLLLWPEGALRFENTAQRESAINRVKDEIKGPIVGVTFTEPVPPSAGWTHSRDGAWRNGLVLVGPNGLIAEFYKRNLVPIAESFSLTESKEKPELYEIELHGSKSHKKWTPAPPYDRTISLTAAICLDFSSPSIFTSLKSRPTVILAPARTWHRDVSIAMWEQARARAEEAGSMVLFCDGGAEGASGVAGHGIREPVQFGSGSWTRTVGVAWPFNQNRTLHMWGGDALPFGFVWLLLGAGWATQALILRRTLGESGGVTGSFLRLRELVDKIKGIIRRPAPSVEGEQRPLLL